MAGCGGANGPFGERAAEQRPRAPLEQPVRSPDGERWRLPAPATATLSELFAPTSRDGGATGFLLAQVPRGKPLLWVQERMAILETGRTP